jgi:hypothetical protein
MFPRMNAFGCEFSNVWGSERVEVLESPLACHEFGLANAGCTALAVQSTAIRRKWGSNPETSCQKLTCLVVGWGTH